LTDDAKVQGNLKYDQKMTAPGQIRKHTPGTFPRRALRVPRMRANVRFGSKAEVKTFYFDVRFTPKSGHCWAPSWCPL